MIESPLRNKPHAALIRTFVALTLPLIGYAFSIAVRTGLADTYAEPAKDFLQTKRNAGEALAQEEWQVIHDGLTQALKLAPDDPENISELGRLHRILLEADDLDAEQISRYGDSASRYYRAAIARRPTWPWDWGDLARVKYEQYQDASDIYQDALARAIEFGPQEASLQDQVAWLGTNSWTALRPVAALAVLTAADRALEADADSLDWMFEETEGAQLLCARVGEPFTFLKRRCETLGLT